MRYEDASGAFQASGPVANDDSDTLAAGSRGPATGNLITGEGTQYGAAGADTAAGAHVTAIAGKGGEDSSFAAGKLSVGGEYGQLSVDAEGNYSYMANKGAPENVRDRFTYTLADNQGNSDTAALIVEIGKTPVVIKADAQQIVPGPDGVVTLPPGVELSDIMVVGRNLVVNMPDGTQLIIVDGAVFVPQLVLGGVEVPATNVATLLIGQEPQPAAGETPPSSGGNFALPPPPLDPGVPLGDLLPPTQYTYQPPEPQETFLPEDNEPEIFVQPDGQPATVAAVDQVEEAGLPERDGDLLDEPAGSGESADGDGTDNDVNSETTTGNIIYTSEDTPNVITINGVEITSVGQVIPGDFGDLTITSIAPGIIGYSYTLHDNTDGNDTHDDFAVQLVDADGDIASATLRIDIIDDVPTARPDTDTVGDGADPFVATGNVMTDAAPGDAGDSDTNAADTVGADNARVTFIDSVNAAPGANVPDGSFVDIAGQYGTLRIFSNGDYEYTRGQDTPGGVQDVFNYTLTDGDGDTSTTTLTITIPDNTPDLPDPAAVLLDDDALANGNPGGVGDDVDSQGTPGQLVGSGGDGVLSYAFSGSNTLPAGFTTNLVDASTLQILQGGTVVLTVTLNTATGAYSVEQNNPIDHPAGGDENNLSFGIGVEVEDADGDTDGATLTINVDDDTPVISEVLSGGDVTLDESDAGSPAGFPISDTSVLPVIDVIASFGADGAAAVNATVFGLAITGGPGSGLQTAVGDFPITLVQIDGDTIEGHYNGSNVAFIIQMNGDGTVTLTQNVPLEHVVDGPPGPAHNDPLDLGGLIAATVTITDGDGDVDSASVGIGDALVFLDDGPSVSDQHVTGLVDEDGVLEGAADGGEGDGIAGGVGDVAGAPTVASGSVAAMFNSGADAPLSYGFAANTVAVLEALGLTSNGVALDYAIVGNTVTASTAAGDVFTFELNADGSWEFTLIDQLDHADGGDENDLTINLGNIIQATDADGDFVVGAADGLVITVDDDTPTASLNQVTGLVDEDGVVEGADDGGPGDGIAGGVGDVAGENTVASGSVAAMFNSGADAPLSYGFAANAIAVLEALNLSSNGIALDYSIVGNTVTASTAAGDVFTFELNADGSWEFTLIDQLDHADGGNENDLAINLGAIIEATDADGDSVVGNANGLVITVDDDTPTASANQVTGSVDEDGVLEGADDGGPGDGIAGGVGDVAGENTVASGSVAAMFNSGADAPLSYGFAANAIAVLEALNLSSNGIALDYSIVGNTVTASTAAGDVFTFELNADGSWEFTLIDQLDHADGGNENDLAINLGAIIEATDADGDSVVGNANGLVITVDDDTPTASQNQVTGLVDEDGVVEGIADGGDGDGIAGGVGDVPGAPTVASGSVSSLFNTGADAPLSFGFSANAVAALEGLGLTSNGVALDYAIVGNTVTASTAAGDVFTFELNANGSWEFTLIDQLDHPTLDGLPGDDTENDLTIDLSAIIEATDADGDSVVAAQGGLVITVDDDTPEAENDSAGVGEPGESVTGNVLDNDDTGADAPATVTDVSSVNEPGNNDSNPDPDVFEIQGEFGVLVLNSDGSYEYTRDLGSPGGAVDVFTYELTDADGDSVTATLTITLGDATPNLPDPPIVRLDDDALANGNPGGTGDDVDSQGTPGQLLGTGGDAPLEYNFTGLDTLPAGFSANLVNAGTLQILQGATVVLTISLNNTTGVFSVVQNNPIDHVAGSDENNYQFLVGVEVEDVDGDVEPATITINVDDDTPTVSANAAVQLDDETETGGIAGGTGDVDPNTANTSGTLGHSFGADGAGSVAYLTTGAPAGFTYELSGSDLLIKQGTTTVITLTLNPATGQYTVTQNAPISHAPGGNENDTSFTINYRVTDGDGDTVDGTLIINSDDDTPVAAIAETGQSVSVDESVGIQVDSNDTTNAAVIALFAGVANVGTDTHLPQYAQNASAVVNSTGSAYGADGAGSTLFSLNVSSAGVDSGLNTTAGQDILLYNEGGLIVGRVSGGADDGKAAFAIAIDPVTGVISMVEYLSIQHPNAANPDDSVSIADGAVLAVVTVTDSDGDTATQQVGIGSAIQFQDSAPVMTAVQNMNIQNSGDVAHTAQFAFNLGADGANIATNDVITNVTGSATVGGVPVQNWTLTPGVENATTASYSFSFDYGIGGGATAHATGTLVFDKVAGTYTIDLASPIQGVTTILQTAQGTLFQGYEFGTSTPDGSQPEISVTQIQDLAGTANDIYVQFTSVAEPSSGTGNNALEVTNWVPGADNPPPIDAPPNPDASDFSWSAGQLFNQTDSWVSTSNDANGVAGDTIQGGEVLDFNLVQGANPTGTLANPANYAQASAMFLKFDGIGTGEDMIVILKLYDPNTNSYTTRAIMVENSDIQKGPGAGPGQYSGITLDNNDGLVIIESNDYNLPGENWVIVGAQIAGSDEDVTGTAINLNSAIGAAGDSYTGNAFDLDPDGFQSDTNDGPFKISSIGFLTTQTTPQNAQLDFNVTVTDGDGDSITQAISATITAAADSVSAATIPAGNVTINSVLPPDPAGSDSSSISNLSYSNDNGKWNGNGNNKSFSSINNTGIVAGMVAAAGLQSLAVAGSPTIESSFDVGLQGKVSTIGLPAYQLQSIDDGSLNVQSFGLESSEPALDFAALQGSSHSFSDFIDNGGLDIQSYTDAAAAYQPNFQADQGPLFDASMLVASVAPAVGMPSAEALIAAGIAGVQQGGSVEQILADALDNQAPTVDGLLEAVNGGGEAISPAIEAALHALPSGGGVGDLSAVLNGASPDVGAVSGWDMHSAGSFGAGFDMMFKMDVAMLHQDAVQPAING